MVMMDNQSYARTTELITKYVVCVDCMYCISKHLSSIRLEDYKIISFLFALL